MTVQELIEELKKFPSHMIVVTGDKKYTGYLVADSVEYIGDSSVKIGFRFKND